MAANGPIAPERFPIGPMNFATTPGGAPIGSPLANGLAETRLQVDHRICARIDDVELAAANRYALWARQAVQHGLALSAGKMA